MKPTTQQLEFTSRELAALLCEREDACRTFPGWERSMDRLVGLHVRAELQLAEGDAVAGQTIARIEVLLSLTSEQLELEASKPQLVREASQPQRPELSHVRSSSRALGPMELLVVNATREGLRSEEGFLRGLLRSELARQNRSEGASTDILTTTDAAAVAGVTPKTIRAWVASGRLEPLGSRPFKFRRETVEAARDRMPCEQNVIDYDARAEEILGGKRRR